MPERERKAPKMWQRPVLWLFELGQGPALALCTALWIAMALVDFFTPSDIDLSFAYALVILLATWNIGPSAGIVFAVAAACMQYVVLSELPLPRSSAYWYLELLNRLFTFSMAVILTGALRRNFDILRDRSQRDALTDAVNASYFIELLQSEIARAARSGLVFTLAYLDLDDFKSVNTQHGHLKGDAVLRAVVDTAKKNVRGIDIVARLGGDEFAILFPLTDRPNAMRVLDRLQSALRKAMQELGVATSVSIGALSVQSSSVTANDVLSAGDELMFRAKREGKDRIVHENLGVVRAPAALRSV